MQPLKLFVSTLLILFLAAYSAFSGEVGITSVYSSTSTRQERRAMPFTMPEDGKIISISIYHNGAKDPTDRMILAVYDGSSSPNSRLGVTDETVIDESAGWQTINLDPVSVSGGQPIWLAWVFEDTPGVRYQTGSPGRYQSSQTWSGRMPNPFGSGSQSSYRYSIYATYTTSAAPEISDIPGQIIEEGANFTDIYLNDYVTDDDTPLSYLEWTAAGQVNIDVVILFGSPSTKIARMTYPVGWTGSETVTFTVEDPEGNTDSDDATFTVTEPVYYTLTTSTTGCPEGNITLNPTGPTYLEGTEVTCIASPAKPYFLGWSGDLTSTDEEETIVMDGDKSITANFEAVCAPQSEWDYSVPGVISTDAHVLIGGNLSVNGDYFTCKEIRGVGHQGLVINEPLGTINVMQIGTGELVCAMLDVGADAKIFEGKVYAREVIVTLDPLPDYVFEKNYNLKPLSEIESYINKNKHLPGIPSAGEVKENGLSLGEMQAKLLEKIEEMTLYMIELKKENKELRAKIEEIESK